MKNLDDYQPIENIHREHPQITINQMRWIIVNKDRYKIAHAIKRIGRRIYFHVPSLLQWIDEQSA